MPVDPTTHSPLGKRLQERTQPLAPDDHLYGWSHAALCEGMMLPFAQLAELVDPPDPYLPWEPLFDVDLCPGWALPWLGQIVGVRVPNGMSDDDARAFIKELRAFKRGSPEAIKSAAKFALTGSKTVTLHERDNGDAYALEVVVLTSETPSAALVAQYILTQKPAGIVFTLANVIVTPGWIYQDMTLHYTQVNKKYSGITSEFQTYTDLQLGHP